MLRRPQALRLAKGAGIRKASGPELTRTNRKGCHCVGAAGGDLRDIHMLLDARALSPEEIHILAGRVPPVEVREIRDLETDKLLRFLSPYEPTPRAGKPHKAPIAIVSVSVFHFRDPWTWTIPAALLGIRPEGLCADRAIDLFCEYHARSNHERLSVRQMLAA